MQWSGKGAGRGGAKQVCGVRLEEEADAQVVVPRAATLVLEHLRVILRMRRVRACTCMHLMCGH